MTYDAKFYLAIAPIVVINMALVVWASIDWNKRKSFKITSKNVWILIIFFIQLFGPIAYLLFGRDLDND